MYTVRILHLSDLHVKANRESEKWARRRVLGDDAWLPNLDALLKDGDIDLLCFTGDLAYSGREKEYAEVTSFLEKTCERVKVPRERVFVVPGNHDIDRTVEADAWKELRSLKHHEANSFSKWIAGGDTPRGFNEKSRDAIVERQAAYRAWVSKTLCHPALVPGPSSPHPRLGYRETITLPGRPFPVHLIGLDSAWLAGDESDQGKLLLTDEQIGRLMSTPEGEKLDGLRIALMHHPLDHLADASQCRNLLTSNVELLLRGHLHEPDPTRRIGLNGEMFELAAGCLYQHHLYPNACHLLTVTCDDQGRPMHLDLHFRAWSPRGHWYDDNSISPNVKGGRVRWWSREERHPVKGTTPTPNAPASTTPAPSAPQATLSEMRAALVRYVDAIPRIRMLLRDAGIEVARVSLGGSAIEAWDSGLEEAKKADLLPALLRVACQEYPSAEELRALASKLGV